MPCWPLAPARPKTTLAPRGEDSGGPSDITPPSISLTAPKDGQTLTGLATFSASASDNTKLAEVRYLVDGTDVGSVTSEPYQLSWDSTGSINGNYVVTAIALDVAGNTDEASAGFSVENGGTPPGTVQVT